MGGDRVSTETSAEWTVGIVATTTVGDVVLRMTSEQAAELRDQLAWLTDDDEESA